MADPGPLRCRVEVGLFQLVQGSVRALPHRLAARVGAGWGDIWRAVSPGRRRLALENLARALPEIDEEQRRRLARQCFRELGTTVAEILSFGRFDATDLCRHVTVEGWDHLKEAEEDERGVMLLSAHVGNWEMAAQIIGLYAGPLHVVVRAMDNPALDRRIRGVREAHGNHTLVKRGAVRGILKTLRAGGRVGILVDQRARRSAGVLVPFLGRPAWTTTTPAAIALRTGSPVVPVFGERRSRGRLLVRVRPPIRPGGLDGSNPEAIAHLTTRYVEAVEEQIRRNPGSWTWMHDRWRQ